MDAKIFEIALTPYPRKLYIVCGGTAKDINDNYIGMDNKPVDFTKESKYGFDAITMRGKNKETFELGYLIWIPKRVDISIVCHESYHVVEYMMSDVGIETDVDHQEAFAYMMGFVAKTVWETMKFAFQKKSNFITIPSSDNIEKS